MLSNVLRDLHVTYYTHSTHLHVCQVKSKEIPVQRKSHRVSYGSLDSEMISPVLPSYRSSHPPDRYP